MSTALIDGDILIYEQASVCEKTIAWPYGDGDVLFTRHAHMDEAWVRLLDSIATLTEKAGCDNSIVCITDTKNWRYGVYADYKSNRKASVKPMLVPLLRERMAQEPNGRRVEFLEGDDLMGILQTRKGNKGTVCVTIDKDLKTIPGSHYHFRDDIHFEVSEAEANRWHLVQTLMGDATDGYPGCRGIGEKKAHALLPDPVQRKDIPAVWREIIVPTFEKAGFDEAFALTQARVARILRADEFNLKTRKVKPWEPSPRKAPPTK